MPNYLQLAIDTHVQNKDVNLHKNEGNLVVDHYDNDADDIDDIGTEIGNLDDWMQAANDTDYMAETNVDDIQDVHVRWDKDHDFHTLHHTYDPPLDLKVIRKQHDEVI